MNFTAAAIITDEDGRFLLIKENYGRRRYGPPGGLVERGETPQQAVVREVREETGLRVGVDYLIGLYHILTDEPFLAFAFRCSITTGIPAVPNTGEIASIDWYSASALPEPLTHLATVAIQDANDGCRGVVRSVVIS